jgi:hypothetical protein
MMVVKIVPSCVVMFLRRELAPREAVLIVMLTSSKQTKTMRRRLLISSPSSHPLTGPADPRSLQRTDLSCLIEQNANVDKTEKQGLF